MKIGSFEVNRQGFNDLVSSTRELLSKKYGDVKASLTSLIPTAFLSAVLPAILVGSRELDLSGKSQFEKSIEELKKFDPLQSKEAKFEYYRLNLYKFLDYSGVLREFPAITKVYSRPGSDENMVVPEYVTFFLNGQDAYDNELKRACLEQDIELRVFALKNLVGEKFINDSVARHQYTVDDGPKWVGIVSGYQGELLSLKTRVLSPQKSGEFYVQYLENIYKVLALGGKTTMNFSPRNALVREDEVNGETKLTLIPNDFAQVAGFDDFLFNASKNLEFGLADWCKDVITVGKNKEYLISSLGYMVKFVSESKVLSNANLKEQYLSVLNKVLLELSKSS